MKKILFLSLFVPAFLERTLFDLGPNVELVTLAMLLSASYLGKKESFWLTLLIMLTTDLIIGNTNIFIFTWSGFLIPALITSNIFTKHKVAGYKKTLQGTFLGISSNFFFFVWTNFGVWLLDSWGMYSKTIRGFIQCYINALPFYKAQLISTLIFVTAGFAITEAVVKIWKLSPLNNKILSTNQ